MVDGAEGEIPQLVCTRKKPHVDWNVWAVTKVLEDDDLLREIIVCVGFPTTLVHASLVCKRWLAHASDPKFLSHFRKLNSPCLLGYYICSQSVFLPKQPNPIRFVPMLPQPPELAAIIRCLESNHILGDRWIHHCWNGNVFTRHYEGTRCTPELHRPLCPERRTQILPPFPEVQDQNKKEFGGIFSKEEGNGMSYMYVLGEATKETGKSTTRVYMLQDGEWLIRSSATCPDGICLDPISMQFSHDKLYLLSAISNDIVVLDLMASSYSTIQLPQQVKCGYLESVLSRADDASSVYLIHVKGFQLSIWLHKRDNWSLFDTICLRKMFSNFGMPGHTLEDGNLFIRQVGDNGQFVILVVGNCIFCFDFQSRALHKVYEKACGDITFVHPFMMIWPPTFPALKDDCARNAM